MRPYTERTKRLKRSYELIPTGFNECMDCGKVKPLAEFHVNPSYQTGYFPRCKECHLIKVRTVRDRIRANRLPQDTPTYKECPQCNETKPSTDFNKANSTKDGLMCYCKQCTRKRSRENRMKNNHYEPSNITSKFCPSCETEKPISEFRISRYNKDGYAGWCITCQLAVQKRHREKFPNEGTEAQRKTRYGITPSMYDEMFKSQGGVCAICGEPETAIINGKVLALSIDHDHRPNGAVRQLLCRECNSGLGHFRDSIDLLIRAAEYLRKYQIVKEQT